MELHPNCYHDDGDEFLWYPLSVQFISHCSFSCNPDHVNVALRDTSCVGKQVSVRCRHQCPVCFNGMYLRVQSGFSQ